MERNNLTGVRAPFERGRHPKKQETQPISRRTIKKKLEKGASSQAKQDYGSLSKGLNSFDLKIHQHSLIFELGKVSSFSSSPGRIEGSLFFDIL